MVSVEQAAIKAAQDVLRNSYSPYSNFKVGAALIADDNSIFTGTNVENCSFGLTICAERAAVVKAVSEGATSFKIIALASSSDTNIFPCGACLQVLSEFCDDLKIISVNSDGQKEYSSLKKLLPFRFKRD